ncbi:MAG: hypothetical protein APF76_09250 [Desulfitibacter sp. BRH_c19]|nr:MAG: hypothetical protein APF76_09250 [Desulfitibacter sp. BRH_c19]
MLLILVVLLVVVTGCNEQGTNETEQKNHVAIVNGESILEDSYEIQLSELKEMVQMQYGIDVEEDEELLAELQNQALETLINKTLVLQESESRGIEVSQSEVDESIDQIKSQFEDDAKFEEALAAEGLEIEELADRIKEDMIMEALVAEVAPSTTISEDEISDEEIEGFYEQQMQMAEAQGIEIPSLEEAEAQIVAAIIQQKEQAEQQQVTQEFIAGLREKSEIEVLL